MKHKTDQHEAARASVTKKVREFHFGDLAAGTEFYLAAATPYHQRGDKFVKITAVEPYGDAGSALLNALNLNTAGAAHLDWATPCFLLPDQA
jgi:hypothetical protein